MTRGRTALLVAALALVGAASLGVARLRGANAEPPAVAAPGPGPASAPATTTAEPIDVDAAIRKGVAYLVKAQNKSGSWGSPASNLWDIYAPVPGSFIAFEVAVTAMSVSALLDAGGEAPEVQAAVRRATDWLLENHAKAKRVSADTLYNTWSHAYALEAFGRLLDREKDPDRVAKLKKAAAEAVDLLARFEFVDGGWGYYNFDFTVQRPEHGATSFTTATGLVALAMIAKHGVEVPKRLVERGLALVEELRKPDWSFEYSWQHRFFPQGRVDKIKGSLARTPACIDAMLAWDKPVPAERIAQAFDDLEKYGHFLMIARKHPFPHETWYQNSGYFCFYGFYYASLLLDRAPAEKKAEWQHEIARRLVPVQESDGSWWDYQLYSYHKAYGTSYVLMALSRCERRPR